MTESRRLSKSVVAGIREFYPCALVSLSSDSATRIPPPRALASVPSKEVPHGRKTAFSDRRQDAPQAGARAYPAGRRHRGLSRGPRDRDQAAERGARDRD